MCPITRLRSMAVRCPTNHRTFIGHFTGKSVSTSLPLIFLQHLFHPTCPFGQQLIASPDVLRPFNPPLLSPTVYFHPFSLPTQSSPSQNQCCEHAWRACIFANVHAAKIGFGAFSTTETLLMAKNYWDAWLSHQILLTMCQITLMTCPISKHSCQVWDLLGTGSIQPTCSANVSAIERRFSNQCRTSHLHTQV